MITAQVVLINEDGLILGVSRKTNHNDFGLPGGKMDPEDNGDPMVTAIRECKEETGLDATDLELVFAIHKNGNMGYTYLAKYTGEIEHNEPHVVKWAPMQVLINGSFGRYNEMVSESLTSMGISFEMDIDETKLLEELGEYISKTTRKGYTTPFKFNGIRRNITSKSMWYISLLGSDNCSMEEEWGEHDKEYEEGISNIGEKHNVVLNFPSYYYYMHYS